MRLGGAACGERGHDVSIWMTRRDGSARWRGASPRWAMESFFSSLKVERLARKTYRTRDQARADVFDYIERFYNPRRRHSTIGYLSPMEFEQKTRSA